MQVAPDLCKGQPNLHLAKVTEAHNAIIHGGKHSAMAGGGGVFVEGDGGGLLRNTH